MNETITIQASKFNNQLHYEWEAKLIEQNEHFALIYCEANRTFIHHSKKKQFKIPYPSLEWFYFDRGYTIAISFKPEGLMYYCNITLPSKLNNHVLSFVDLDLDYVKEANEEWKVVDEDEFMIHQTVFGYPEHIISYAYQSLEQLQQAVKEMDAPFHLTLPELQEKLASVCIP